MDGSKATLNDWTAQAVRRKNHAIEIEGTTVLDRSLGPIQARTLRWVGAFIGLLIFALPLMFGGVHSAVYAPAEIGVFLGATVLVWMFGAELYDAALARSAFKLFLVTAGIFLSYAVARIALGLWTESAVHPVLGGETSYATIVGGISWLREVLFFVGAVVCARALILLKPEYSPRLESCIVTAGAITAFVGLAHWFYDNGKLFWFFEPENVFISQRARWPFVNSNHLACFLIPSLFLLAARCFTAASGLRALTVSQRTGKTKSFSDLMADQRVQRRIVSLTVDGALLLAVLLCIIATLSRGVWLSTVVGIVTFIVFDRLSRPKLPPAETAAVHVAPGPKTGRRRSRRHRSNTPVSAFTMSPQVWARLKFFTVAILCLGVYLFLRDRGAELIESRIEYGLLHSKEDMRFQLLADTWPLIVAHPWFGLGVGSWASAYAEVMSPLLAGITPVYLHNDPAQLLAETGLFGFVIVLGGLGALVIKGARAIFASPHRLTLIALVAALTTTFISTAFDFHLRIPAIVIQLGVIIGLLIDFTDRAAR